MKIPRIRFSIKGDHPLIPTVISLLILQGFRLVEEDENPDIHIVGGKADSAPSAVPTIILSSGNVYSCLTHEGKVREISYFLESDTLVIPGGAWDFNHQTQIKAIYNEEINKTAYTNSMILRIFPVYGPGAENKEILSMIYQAKTSSKIDVVYPLHQVTTYLWIEDFEEVFLKCVKLKLEGQTGTYNIGHTEYITDLQLATNINNVFNRNKTKLEINICDNPNYINFWLAPSIQKIELICNWKPAVSIQKGLRLMEMYYGY